MTHISKLIPGKAERVITLGGTRAGKSALQEWTAREIQRERPTAMQIIVDTKPRYRAETERGRFRKNRKPADYRYESWSAGPTIPNSCVVDIWDEHPFKGMWERPGEIAIMQGADFEDWRRMLLLLKGFVNAQIKGRERRIIVDECLDFTKGIHSELIPKTMCSIGLRVQEGSEESESILARIGLMAYLHSSCIWLPDSIYFTCVMTKTCVTYRTAELPTPKVRRETIFSANTESNLAEPCQIHSRVLSICPSPIWHNSPRVR